MHASYIMKAYLEHSKYLHVFPFYHLVVLHKQCNTMQSYSSLNLSISMGLDYAVELYLYKIFVSCFSPEQQELKWLTTDIFLYDVFTT